MHQKDDRSHYAVSPVSSTHPLLGPNILTAPATSVIHLGQETNLSAHKKNRQ
jgi:hypothetical protein